MFAATKKIFLFQHTIKAHQLPPLPMTTMMMNLTRMKAWVVVVTTLAAFVSSGVMGDALVERSDLRDGNAAIFLGDEQRDTLLAEPKIVGGSTAGRLEFQYFVQWWGTEGSCGGTLIHADVVLTAARCNIITSNVQLAVGAYYSKNASLASYTRSVIARSVHPYYNSATGANDFLLLKLNSPVPVTGVPLNSDSNSPYTNELLTVIGLGGTYEGGSTTPYLRKVKVNYVDPYTCYIDYLGISQVDSTVQLCAGVPAGGKDSCTGDGGGPILNAYGVQVGVVSTGRGCGRVGFPGIYSRVSSAITWIRQQVCTLSLYPPVYCYIYPVTSTLVRFDINYDSFASETSFNVFNSSRVVFTSGASSAYNNKLVSRFYYATPGYYFWQLYDSASDAFCCYAGLGFYAAYAVVNGRYQKLTNPTKGVFSGVQSVPIEMPVPPYRTGTISSSPGSGTTVKVEVQFDNYPTETGFAIYNILNQIVGSSALALSSYAGNSYFYTFVLAPGYYTVQFADTGSDGFCCQYGIGYYAVYAVVNGAYQALIAPTYAAFTYLQNVYIYVPTKTGGSSRSQVPPQLEPPPSIYTSVCCDSPNKFAYNETINGTISETKRSCQWLASSPAKYDLLCKPDQEAYKACPKTCGKCVDRCEGQDNATATFLIDNVTSTCAGLQANSSLWPYECVADKPAYTYCKHVCKSCDA